MSLDQVGIVVFGVSAVALSQSPRAAHRRWAPVLGMAGQPFWIWSALSAHQPGVLAVVALYTLAWARGLWDSWARPWLSQRRAMSAILREPLARYTVEFVPADPNAKAPERVYLAGPVTGVPGHRETFGHWAARLRASGFEVVSPVEHDLDEAAHSWVWWMRRGLRQLLDCDRVAMLPGWQGSRGALIEHFIATVLCMRPIYLRAAA